MVGIHKTSRHLKIFLTRWAYRTSVKHVASFMPFQIVYGLKEFLPIECEIASLKVSIELLPNTTIEEERFLYLNQLEKLLRDVAFTNETHKKCLKAQYDKNFQPCLFKQGDLVLTYDQRYNKLGKGKS